MLYVLLIFCLFLVINDWKRLIPIYLCLSLWINVEVKCGPMSFMGVFIMLSSIWGFTLYRNKTMSNLLNRYVFFFIIYLFFSSIPVILFSTTMEYQGQMTQLRTYVFYVIIPLMCAIAVDMKGWHNYSKYFYIATLFLCVYGVFCYLTGTNYYADFMSSYYTKIDIIGRYDISMDDARFGLKHRIIGTATGSLPYAILMAIWLWFLYGIRTAFPQKYMIWILSILCILNLILTGSRGPIIAFFISVLYVFYTKFSKKQKVFASLTCVILLLSPFFSLFVDSSNDVGGSSIEMRLSQAEGVVDLITNNWQTFLWGHGFGYANDYIDTYGVYTSVHSFESVLFSGLSDSGIYGILFIFGGKIYLLWYYAHQLFVKGAIADKDYRFLCGFVVMHVIYNILVGDSYTLFFYCMYFLLMKFFILKHKSYVTG